MGYTYTENKDFNIIIRVDENGITSSIPLDPANPDYQAYLAAQSTPIVTEDEQ
jgi:hypothetical protein